MVLMTSRTKWFRQSLGVTWGTVATLALGNMCVRSPILLAGSGPGTFSGAQALAFTRQVVSFGARPSGSREIKKLQAYIVGELKGCTCQVMQDDFTASTPLGPIPMKNILARFPGTSGKAVVFTGHFDTKSMPGTYFVGANDGGSSAGFAVEMAKAVGRRPPQHNVFLVGFDADEAIAQP